MSYHVFLDDIRSPNQVLWAKLPENVSWIITRSFHDFRDILIKHGVPNFVAFDCDLAEEHYLSANKPEFLIKQYAKEFKTHSGIDCALLLIEQSKVARCRPPNFVVHSMNRVGGGEIIRLMEKAQKEFDIAPKTG